MVETALVIAVSHQVQALVPAATHLAAADSAEALRDRPAAEEVIVWAGAASAEVGAAEEAAEEAEEAAEDKQTIERAKKMKTTQGIMTPKKIFLIVSLLAICGLSAAPAGATEPKQSDTATSEAKPKEFNTPKEAADSLLQAAEAFDIGALTQILGPDSKDVLTSEDPVQDKNRAMAFVAKAKEKNTLGIDPKNPNQAILTVGNGDFSLPIPIVKKKGKWMFDMKTGREEILNRRVGANELDAIAICRGFVEAQQKYAQEKHDDSKVNQYAQRIISTPGKHDGLAWQNADGTWAGPVGEGVARALEQGYSKQGQPFHGYYFKVLKGQGPAAPLGQMDFVVNGAMIGGFALAAAPAQYRVTGVKTFMVGPNGVVYEKDLGKDTLKAFEAMDKYNPDKTWKPTDDEWPEGQEEAAPNESPSQP